jgi:predicted PurR-regulated permease PerM
MRAVTVSIGPRTIIRATVAVAALVAMVVALRATRNVIADLALAAVIAALVRPGVLRLARRTRLGFAIFVVYAALLVGVAGVLSAEAGALSAGTNELRHAVPDRLGRLQRGLAPQNALRRFLVEGDVVARLRAHINGIPSRFLFGTASPTRGASQVGLLLLVASLSAFMISRGPAMFRTLATSLPAEWQSAAGAAARAAYRRGGAYIRRTVLLAAVVGVAAGGIAGVCGVPGAGVMGLWIGLWAMVPRIGITFAALPVGALAFGQGTAEGVAAVAGLVTIAVAGEMVRARWIERPTVTVGPLLSLVAAMAGMELDRWSGAFVLLVFVTFLVAALQTRPNFAPAAPTPNVLPALGGRAGADTASAGSGRVTVDVDAGSLVLAVAVGFVAVVVVVYVRAVPHSLARLTVAVLLALALNQLVGLVQRHVGGRRGVAVGVVVVGFVSVVVAFAIFAVPSAVEQSRRVGTDVRDVVAQLDRAPIVGGRVRRSHVDTRIRAALDDLPHLLAAHQQTLSDAAQSAGEGLLAAGWVVLVAFAALLDGPRIVRLVDGAIPAQRRGRVERVGALAYETVGRSAAGSAFSALLQGGVVLVVALIFRVPLAPVLAANAALWSFVPQVGGLFAGLPLFLFALTQGLGTAAICGVLFLVYMEINNHFLHAVIVGRAVHISPLASLVAVLIGVSLAGFVGGILATPIAGVLRALVGSPAEQLPP